MVVKGRIHALALRMLRRWTPFCLGADECVHALALTRLAYKSLITYEDRMAILCKSLVCRPQHRIPSLYCMNGKDTKGEDVKESVGISLKFNRNAILAAAQRQPYYQPAPLHERASALRTLL